MQTIISIISLVHAYVRGQIFRHSAQQVIPRLVRDGKALGVVIAIHQPGDLDVRYAITGGSGAPEISYVTIAGGEAVLRAVAAAVARRRDPPEVCRGGIFVQGMSAAGVALGGLAMTGTSVRAADAEPQSTSATHVSVDMPERGW